MASLSQIWDSGPSWLRTGSPRRPSRVRGGTLGPRVRGCVHCAGQLLPRVGTRALLAKGGVATVAGCPGERKLESSRQRVRSSCWLVSLGQGSGPFFYEAWLLHHPARSRGGNTSCPIGKRGQHSSSSGPWGTLGPTCVEQFCHTSWPETGPLTLLAWCGIFTVAGLRWGWIPSPLVGGPVCHARWPNQGWNLGFDGRRWGCFTSWPMLRVRTWALLVWIQVPV